MGICCIALIAIMVAAGLWVMNAPAVPRASLAKLRAGMDAEQVTLILGSPRTRSAAPHGAQTWTYSRMTWAYLTIDFDADEKVTGFYHDE